MQLYRFEVINKGEVIAVQPTEPLRDAKAAWPEIAKIAQKISLPGCCIRVRDPSGEIVILIGAAAAQHHAHPIRPYRAANCPSTLCCIQMSVQSVFKCTDLRLIC